MSAIGDDNQIDDDAICAAADLLRSGKVVAFPTETVYGLGANALDSNAVAGIFAAKGRPAHNPLIVHVSSIEQARTLIRDWPEHAQDLAEVFWPGPLTLVLKKSTLVPEIVTAGGDTVALRIPSHPVALALINACGFPLAAPSANRSNFISPTTAAHVARSLDGIIPMILDGGPCVGGIESTVLNLAGKQPEVLRPGALSANFLSQLLNTKVVQAPDTISEKSTLMSPGQLKTHYAPDTPLYLAASHQLQAVIKRLLQNGKRVGLMGFDQPSDVESTAFVHMPATPELYARRLYAALHEMDEYDLDIIICELPPNTMEWTGIHDRLTRAGRTVSELN